MKPKASKDQQPQHELGASQKHKVLGTPRPLNQNLHFTRIRRGLYAC